MRQLKIGGMRIDRLVEIDRLPFEKNWLFANADDEVIEANRGWLDHRYIEPGSGRFILSHHSYVVRTPQWTAVVDTCCGNHKDRPRVPVWHQLNQPYLDNMRALGVRPEDVDFVMCTHLHVDHVGWNTRLLDGRWVPTFPKARYLMGETEYDHWERQYKLKPERRSTMDRSRIPYFRWWRRDRPSSSKPTTACSTTAKPACGSCRRRATPSAT